MAGAITVATIGLKAGVTRYEITWVSDAVGDVSGSTFSMKQGTIIGVEFIPGPGALQPDALYDVDLRDQNGVSAFDNGAGTSVGSNLSNTLSTRSVPLIGLSTITVYRRWHPQGSFQPVITNAGDTNAGTVNVFVVDGIL